MIQLSYKTLHAPQPFGIVDTTRIPDETIPDLNVDLYEMLVRHQNGQITTLGGYMRNDAHYDTPEDCDAMHVSPLNDPNFNLISAPFYLDAQHQRVEKMVEEDKRSALIVEPEASTETEQSGVEVLPKP